MDNEINKLSKNSRLAILLGLLAIMLTLQFVAINSRSFWVDETVTGRLVKEEFPKIVEQRANNNHPPLYWLSVAVWSKVVGISEPAIKVFSVVWLGLAFFLLYKFSLDLVDEHVALIAAGIFAFSPLVLTYGHNARYYSMAAALSLLAAIAVYRYLNLKNNWWLIVYVIAGVALLYSVYMGGLVLLALNIWWLAQWLHLDKKIYRLLVWALPQLVLLLLYIPWIPILLASADKNLAEDPIVSNWALEIFMRVGYIFYAFSMGEFFSPLNPVLWLGLLVIFGATIFAVINAKGKLSMPIIILFVVEGISVLFNIVAVYPQSAWQNLPNRTFFVYPFFIIVLAYGVAHLKLKLKWSILAMILIIYSLGAFNYFSKQQVMKPILTVPWNEIFTNIQVQSSPDAVVLCTAQDTTCFYYQTQYGFKQMSPQNWDNMKDQNPSQVWWVQTSRNNISSYNRITEDEQVIQSIKAQYIQTDKIDYVPLDPKINLLKTRFLGYENNEFGVIVYKFELP